MRVIPFEIGYVSAMSDHEMLDLSTELEHSGWREEQKIIRSAVDNYMEHVWRRPANTSGYFFPMPFSGARRWNANPSPYASTVYKTLTIHVPDSVDEEVARVLAEMQLREQLYGEYDPRHPEDD